MRQSPADIVREYGPFPGVDQVHGVSYDGQHVWFASGDTLHALDPENGQVLRSIDVAAHAGTAYDGKHLYQLAEDRIQKIDPESGRVLATIPSPGHGADSDWRGPRAPSGSGSTVTGRFIRSIPRRARSCARSSRTGS